MKSFSSHYGAAVSLGNDLDHHTQDRRANQKPALTILESALFITFSSISSKVWYMMRVESFVVVGFLYQWVVVAHDYFNYGMDDLDAHDGPSYGQPHWNEVTCSNVETCVSDKLQMIRSARNGAILYK
jgi:hypothetical protein